MKLNIFKRDTPELPVYPTEILGEDDDDGTMVENVEKLGEAVIGHRIVCAGKEKVKGRWGLEEAFVITLDNGKKVHLIDGGDCCAYTALEEFLLHPESVNHIILGVGTTDQYTTWHIFADFGDILALTLGWSCGNPFYYSYGFDINIIDPDEPKKTIFDDPKVI